MQILYKQFIDYVYSCRLVTHISFSYINSHKNQLQNDHLPVKLPSALVRHVQIVGSVSSSWKLSVCCTSARFSLQALLAQQHFLPCWVNDRQLWWYPGGGSLTWRAAPWLQSFQIESKGHNAPYCCIKEISTSLIKLGAENHSPLKTFLFEISSVSLAR